MTLKLMEMVKFACLESLHKTKLNCMSKSNVGQLFVSSDKEYQELDILELESIAGGKGSSSSGKPNPSTPGSTPNPVQWMGGILRSYLQPRGGFGSGPVTTGGRRG